MRFSSPKIHQIQNFLSRWGLEGELKTALPRLSLNCWEFEFHPTSLGTKMLTRWFLKQLHTCLYFLKQLRQAAAPPEDMLLFYTSVIRSVLEYAAQFGIAVWPQNRKVRWKMCKNTSLFNHLRRTFCHEFCREVGFLSLEGLSYKFFNKMIHPDSCVNEMRVYCLDLEIRRNILSLLHALKDLRGILFYMLCFPSHMITSWFLTWWYHLITNSLRRHHLCTQTKNGTDCLPTMRIKLATRHDFIRLTTG